MSEWTPPQSVEYRAPASGLGVLRNLFEALARRISALEGAAPLKQAGIYLTTLGMRIASSLTVEGDLTSTGAADITGTTHIGGATDIDGTLNVDAATTIGGTLGVTGATTLGAATSVTGALNVTGPMAITGTLSLPAGIIDNDALANPITYASDKSVNVGAGVTTTRTDKATATVAVPAGFTKAQVWAFSDAIALNSTASLDYLYVHTVINTYDGGENILGCESEHVTTISHVAVTALTGLTGGDLINCTVQSRTGFAPWDAAANNMWRIQAVVIFSR